MTPDAVVAVAAGRKLTLGPRARARMERTRAVIERALEHGDPVYGVTRGVGALKTVALARHEQDDYNRALLLSHNVGSGPVAAAAHARAAMGARAAGLSLGYAGVRPCVVDALCAALNAGVTPRLHTVGSVGQADLSQMAEIGLMLAGQGSPRTNCAPPAWNRSRSARGRRTRSSTPTRTPSGRGVWRWMRPARPRGG